MSLETARKGRSRLSPLPARVQALSGGQPQTAGTLRIRGATLMAIRDRIMRRDCGLCRCEQCQATGAIKPAHEVDHRIPLWAGGGEDDSNRYAINRDCHKAKTAREAAQRASGETTMGGVVKSPKGPER